MVADRAQSAGFEAVEFRTFGDDSRMFACDPALSSTEKVRRLFKDRGVEILSLATSHRFDAMIHPPVIGYLSKDHERSVREAQRAVDLAVSLECPLVRVFAFEHEERESESSALKRICGRLALVVDHAEKSGVRIVVENGGSFGTARALMRVLDEIKHPLLSACYALAAGQAAGDQPEAAVEMLGERLHLARVKDLRDGKPVELGKGQLHAERFVKALAASGFSGPLVYEWDRAWMGALSGDPTPVLRHAAETIVRWVVGGGVSTSAAPGAARTGTSGARPHARA